MAFRKRSLLTGAQQQRITQRTVLDKCMCSGVAAGDGGHDDVDVMNGGGEAEVEDQKQKQKQNQNGGVRVRIRRL
eukprot:3448645-Rhodomonas_salina.2